MKIRRRKLSLAQCYRRLADQWMDSVDPFSPREERVKAVKGMGLAEASAMVLEAAERRNSR